MAAVLAPAYEVDGRLDDGAGESRRSWDDPLSRSAGEPDRERDDSSFNRRVRSNCSNCFVRSFAHSSPRPSPGVGGG